MANERTPLFNGHSPTTREHRVRRKAVVHGGLLALTVIFIIAFAVLCESSLPREPHAAVEYILAKTPVIDSHIDLPFLLRAEYAYNTSAFDMNDRLPAHLDIPRLRKGHVGGFFWSVYMPCPTNNGPEDNFLNPTDLVRDTLEQIDVSRILIDQYSNTFQLALSADDVRSAFRNGKVASMLGAEGAHQIQNSLAVLRQYHALGVRYLTLTHFCDNAFADGAQYNRTAGEGTNHGLSDFGKVLVGEMNRLGMMVDLSHTTDETAREAIAMTKAPVIWSHSSARAIHDHIRNVPDDILGLLSTDPEDGKDGKVDGVVMVNFHPDFVADPGQATLSVVADHIEHIAKVAGKAHVGIGSDYDGIKATPVGLEDVSTYPALFAELYSRGTWSQRDLAGLASENFLRVFEKVGLAGEALRKDGAASAMDVYERRRDLGQGSEEL